MYGALACARQPNLKLVSDPSVEVVIRLVVVISVAVVMVVLVAQAGQEPSLEIIRCHQVRAITTYCIKERRGGLGHAQMDEVRPVGGALLQATLVLY